MSSFEEDKLVYDYNFNISGLIGAGIWEYNTKNRTVVWSESFYKILGYSADEIPSTPEFFFESLLYHEDKAVFLYHFYNTPTGSTGSCEIRLLTNKAGYRWFKSTFHQYQKEGQQTVMGAVIDIHHYKLPTFQTIRNNKESSSAHRLARTGGWLLQPETMKLTLTPEAYELLELHDQTPLTLNGLEKYLQPNHQTFAEYISDAITYCKPFESEHLCQTARNNWVWLRAKAVPYIDDIGRCIRIQGVFQNIDYTKHKEEFLQQNISSLNDQYKRLQNFSYIVAHNLRSNAGNLKMLVGFYEQSHSETEKLEMFAHIKSIAESLSITVRHLDEIVKIQADLGKGHTVIRFDAIFNNVIMGQQSIIDETGAIIQADFSKVQEVDYVPAYMESIFQNMLTNSLKYRHPDRTPRIHCYTDRIDNHTWLFFEDNGIGIDLKRHGDSVFGMYQTFHSNADAKGIGLFITKNQIEALGGSITVDSEVNVGTKFSIRLT